MTTIFRFSFLLCFAVPLKMMGQQKLDLNALPGKFRQAVKEIEYGLLGTEKGIAEIREVNKNTVHLRLFFKLGQSEAQNDWRLNIRPAFTPDFNWAPHLTPGDNNIIAQHVFRSPALIATDKRQALMVIPDLDIINKVQPVEWYMDVDAPRNLFTLGMSKSRVTDHVIFERATGAFYPAGEIEFGFYLMYCTDKESVSNPFGAVTSFMWEKWGTPLFNQNEPSAGDQSAYVAHAYKWAFDTWKEEVWQELEIAGERVGAPVFIVNVTQSPNYPGKVNEREFRSIWNQAWFSSLRSASGLYRYARRTSDDQLMRKALYTKELALQFPKKKGFFYGLIGTDMEMVEIDGNHYNRSKGWDDFYWGNTNRNPYTWDARTSPFHLLDMSWTAFLMLKWYGELEKDERLLNYATEYADALLGIQQHDGFFPAWLDTKDLEPLPHLRQSPETSMSVTFLLNLYHHTKDNQYRVAALRAMEAVMRNIIYEGRWEDFETYWSCSRIGSHDWVGQKVKRNNMYKHNNFSMFWTAEALLESYRTTRKKKYLKAGQRVLDELLMTQAVWQPHFIPIKTLGGFGVLNADGEWNDARQSLFSELIVRYGIELNNSQYVERGLAAMRASFVMMYCPENPATREQWEKVWPFFGKEDFGFMMENYGHGGEANEEGLGIGEFTIYDWGNGAAAEAYNRLLDHYGEDFVNSASISRKQMSELKKMLRRRASF